MNKSVSNIQCSAMKRCVMKKLLMPSIVFLTGLFMIFSAVSCTTLLDSDAPKVLDSAATDTAVTLENLVIAEEYNEEDNINMSIGHKKSVFGNLEQDISYDDSTGQDLFYNDTVVYDQTYIC